MSVVPTTPQATARQRPQGSPSARGALSCACTVAPSFRSHDQFAHGRGPSAAACAAVKAAAAVPRMGGRAGAGAFAGFTASVTGNVTANQEGAMSFEQLTVYQVAVALR